MPEVLDLHGMKNKAFGISVHALLLYQRKGKGQKIVLGMGHCNGELQDIRGKLLVPISGPSGSAPSVTSGQPTALQDQ